jgi:hypothetical protein
MILKELLFKGTVSKKHNFEKNITFLLKISFEGTVFGNATCPEYLHIEKCCENVKTYFHENNIHILGLQVFMRDQMIERNASEDYFIFGLNKNKSFIRGRGLRASQMV